MPSQISNQFDCSQQAIYLLNNTIHTQFKHLLKEIPTDIKIFVNRTLEKRYLDILQKRDYGVISTQNVFTFRTLLRRLRDGRPVFVFLDVDQAAFQAIGYIAYQTKTPIVPVYVNHRSFTCQKRIELNHLSDVLPTIQSFLFETYMQKDVDLFNELLAAARYYGDEAVVCKDISGQINYKNLLLNIYVLSQRLRKETTSAGKNIGVFLPNSIGNLVTLFSLFYIGKTPVMLNYSAGAQTIIHACETADLTTILTSREFIAKGQLEAVEAELKANYRLVYLEDVKQAISAMDKIKGFSLFLKRKKAANANHEVILFTSGSEFRPKGVVLSHGNIFANVQQTRAVIDFGVQDKMLNAMPMFHSFGLTAGAILPLLCGVQTYLYPSPLHYKRIPELAREEGSTILFGTSSFLEKYGQFAKEDDFRTMRYAVVGAERLKEEVERFWLDKFNLQIMQGYGATETAPIMCLDTPLNHKQGSVGRFLPAIQHDLEDVPGIPEGGKLFIKGPNLMKGYLLHEQGYIPTDGWYDTGDVVTVDEAGFVTIIGRLKRFAKLAGEMVSLNLVEQLAAQCYGSTDFAAINVPDSRRGEKIILVTTDPNLSLASLQTFIAQTGYSRLHTPSEVRWIEEFPLMGSGKTDYVALKQLVQA
ncbi:AMP-binding protein [Alicyclobacillus fodiniaquatilis]|uniref:AMP-binding protein n=1 Tax=Alicyclobacillus fodiniaquatilis TaxID=1661150 RepID=A0ABW4JL33_9BACL